MSLRKLLKWYLNNFANSYIWAVFMGFMYLVNLYSFHTDTACSFLCAETPYEDMALVSFLFEMYVVMTLFTFPFESSQHLFEHTLPFTRTEIFLSKYTGGYLFIYMVFSAFYVSFSIIIYGYFSVSAFMLMLASLFLMVFYTYNLLVFFAVMMRKNIGVIIGVVILFIVDIIVSNSSINFPPNTPVWSGYVPSTIAGAVFLVASYIIYRRCDL